MEHEILRKMQEPRIHFAIACASIGCPKLLNRAYLPGMLEQQLADNTRAFFSDSSKFRYDSANRMFYCSPILDWFKADFGRDQATRLKQIAPGCPSDGRPCRRHGNWYAGLSGLQLGLERPTEVSDA